MSVAQVALRQQGEDARPRRSGEWDQWSSADPVRDHFAKERESFAPA